ncbi:hypothetical protein [Prosthecobacter sp.]|uniref:hypothetical protein n=1 Tax=Prosthecobacter sp. TaxID=1965333 RepID=UPI0037842BD3
MNPPLTPLFAVMSPEGMLGLKVIGVLGLIAIIPAGVILYRNQDRWFGRSSDTPSETSGSLVYGLAQTWLVYVGLLHLMLWLAFGL